MMRISKDPDDKAYSPTAGDRKVWCNDQEIKNWVTADEFRRSIVMLDKKVLNGAVRVERLAEDGAPPEPDLILEMPASVGFAGAGLVQDKPVTPPERPEHPEHPEEPEQSKKPTETGRPGDPDKAVVDTPSKWFPDEGITSV